MSTNKPMRLLAPALVAALALVAGIPAAGATTVGGMSGVWQSGSDPYYLWVGEDWQGFTAKWKELAGQGLRLVDVERYSADGGVRYAGVWRGGNDGHFLWLANDWKDFVDKWEELSGKGLRLIDVETFVAGGKRGYLGVWRAGSDRHALWAAPSWKDFTAKWKELSGEGLRLIDLEGYVEGGTTKYLGVFRAGTDGHFLWKAGSWKDFTAKWKELAGKDLVLVDFERVAEDGKFVYVGAFRRGQQNSALWRSSPEPFFDKWEELGEKSLRLVDLELEITGGKPASPSPQAVGKVISECNEAGPFRFNGKRLGNIAYGQDYVRLGATTSSTLQEPNAVVKLVGSVCVEQGEVEYTLHYRTTAWRPVPLVETLRAGQCRCYWTTRTSGWPFELSVRSTAEVKKPGTRYSHKLSVCYTPWRNKCQVRTWEGWK
jgi:hypothetical protein